MKKLIVYASLSLSIILFASSWFVPHAGLRAILLIGSIGGIAGSYLTDRKRERREQEEAIQRAITRKRTLCQDLERPGFVLQIQGRSGMVIGLIFFVMGGAVLGLAPTSFLTLLAGTFCLLLGAFATALALPNLGKPTLELGYSGITTPEYGRISWQEINAVDLLENRHKGSILSHSLVFHIPKLARYQDQFTSCRKLLFRLSNAASKQRLIVILWKTCESPLTILEISRTLLRNATGRCHEWSATVSDSENEAFRNFLESKHQTDNLLTLAEEAAQGNDTRASEAIARKLDAELLATNQHFKHLISANKTRTQRQLLQLKVLVTIALILFAVRMWYIFSR